MGKKQRWFWVILCFFIWYVQIDVGASEEANQQMEDLLHSYMEELDMGELEKSMENILPEMEFSFRGSLEKLVKGEMPLKKETVTALIKDALFAELRLQREVIVQILILVIAAAVFTNFVRVFQKNQISDIAFYIIYLLLFVLVMNGFRELSDAAKEGVGQILYFMRLLLPVYLVVASFASGSMTAVAFYEVTLLFLTAVQAVMMYWILPGIGFYVLFQLLNQLGKEDYLSKLAELIKGILSWTMKTLLALVVGVQTIQGLLLPAIDSLKNSLWTKAAGAIPVLGNTFSAVTETVLGTAVLLKNAVGVAGLLVILLICLVPVVRLMICTFLYKAVGAAVQPVSDKRITECISGVGEGIGMLLKAVSMTGVMFLITLAMVTASIGR